ncbi:MAG: cytidylate kinase [Flavobacteriales bacterium]|nr:cytidylate kinase [Flavobacteriales bacterium]|tara:strand:- start:642 stop:1349 length:708 start_codon:yes stop_codon:yes gene_type:complete
MNNLINIAIDGHSSCGKSTISKAICKKYKMIYIDTGSMYRAVTLFCLENNCISESFFDISKLLNLIDKCHVNFIYDRIDDSSKTFLNGRNVEDEIRSIRVSKFVSQIAKVPQIRKKLVDYQRNMGVDKNIVMDGRDIGSFVFPNAEIKFFVTADVLDRAKRRFLQLSINNDSISFDEVLENIKKRDQSDSTRSINPLIRAEDAILIDTTNVSIESQNKTIFKIINTYLANENRNR